MGSISPQIMAMPGYQGLLTAPPISCYSASCLEGPQAVPPRDLQNPADLPQCCFALTREAQFVNDKRFLRNKTKQTVFIQRDAVSLERKDNI